MNINGPSFLILLSKSKPSFFWELKPWCFDAYRFLEVGHPSNSGTRPSLATLCFDFLSVIEIQVFKSDILSYQFTYIQFKDLDRC